MRLTLGYRGTRYAGWAMQHPARTRGRPTLQATVEGALAETLGHPVRVTVAGRTDAGVHADGQVISLDTSSRMSPEGLVRVLPRWLPDDVWVVDAADAPADFDARHSALRRWYRYQVWRDHVPPPADWQGRCLSESDPLNLPAMRAAAQVLLGRHDFASLLTGSPAARQTTERTVFAADWRQVSQSLLQFEICADAYLKQMVRTIVGTLLSVGTGRWSVDRFAAAIAAADRTAAGPSAPAEGLSLHRIEY